MSKKTVIEHLRDAGFDIDLEIVPARRNHGAAGSCECEKITIYADYNAENNTQFVEGFAVINGREADPKVDGIETHAAMMIPAEEPFESYFMTFPVDKLIPEQNGSNREIRPLPPSADMGIVVATPCKSTAYLTGWILAEERLPGRFDNVLVTVLSINGYGEPATLVTIGGFNYEKNCWEAVRLLDSEKVIAWMPLPEPAEYHGKAAD